MYIGFGYFESEYPEGAQFWDHRDSVYVRLVRDGERLYVEAYCLIRNAWQPANIDSLGLFKSGWKVTRNPNVSWKYLQGLLQDPYLYLMLYEQIVNQRPRLPFLKLRKGQVITKSRYLSWWERLYLCYVRGFKRYPEGSGYYFIKDLKE